MINELRAIAIFAKTVETGSFRAAAKTLKLSPSVVSHHISLLEERLGVTLLYRSTRQLSLTHEGTELFASAKAIIVAAESGLNAIACRSTEPSGSLSVAMPAFFARSALFNDIATFALALPKIALSIHFSDLKQDLIREGTDLAIRIGRPEDSALKAKKLFDMKRTLVASASYVAARGTTRCPDDLAQWDWIGLKMMRNSKTLSAADGQQSQLDFTPRITVDSVDAVCQLALDGLGLATPPLFLVERDMAEGRLVDPLPGWQVEPLSVYAVWPANASKESLTFRLIQFLEQQERARALADGAA